MRLHGANIPHKPMPTVIFTPALWCVYNVLFTAETDASFCPGTSSFLTWLITSATPNLAVTMKTVALDTTARVWETLIGEACLPRAPALSAWEDWRSYFKVNDVMNRITSSFKYILSVFKFYYSGFGFISLFFLHVPWSLWVLSAEVVWRIMVGIGHFPVCA